ncbi:MAG: polysaccharide biosynthesis C-terminal domain-containing protein [Clostridiales bacterium]|nr:polysaccharide biosynthesis C-terminal domain-containing protein [Clostridiales bacterium]
MELGKFKDKLIESLFGNLLMFGLNLLLPMVVSRIYGVDIFGSYVYGITIVSMALLLANLGMDVGLLYFIPKTGKKYVSACFIVNICTSAITVLILFLYMPSSISPYLGLVWLLSAEQLFFSIYRARHHIRDFFLIKSLIGIGGVMLISYILFELFGANEINIIIATYITAIFSNIIYMTQSKDMFGKIEMHMEFISYSVTIILGGVMSLLIAYIDIVMIEAMMTKSDVALYKVGTELAQIPSIFLRIVNTVFPPLISKLYHEGKVDEVRRLYEKLTRYLFLVSSMVIICILFFWKPLLGLYGPEYLDAKMVLIYRGIGQLVNASVGSVWYIVLMTGHPKIRFVSILISAVMNITLNYLLIPTMGIDGAALASMVSTVFINILGFFVVKKILKSKVYYII